MARDTLRRICQQNMYRAEGAAKAFCFAAVILIVVELFCKPHGDSAYLFIAACLVIFVVDIVFAVIIKNALARKKLMGYRQIYFCFWLSSVVLLLWLFYCDFKETQGLYVYAGLLFMLAGFPVLTFKEIMSLMLPQLLAVFFFAAYLDFTPYLVTAAVFMNVCAVSLSRKTYKSTANLFRTQKRLDNLSIQAENDALTGLNNRRGMGKNIDRVWQKYAASGCQVAGIILDIDFFKKYNDKFGHPKGDECIFHVAGCISNAASHPADVVGRIGGEEFFVFSKVDSEEQAIAIARRIQDNLKNLAIPHATQEISPNVTVSIGISIVRANECGDFQQLYNKADKGLYKAKQSGRNCIVCNGFVVKRMEAMPASM